MNLIGIGLLALAFAGTVFYLEAAPSAPAMRSFSALFPTTMQNGPVTQGTAPDGATTAATVRLTQTNITAVRFQFTFTDNYPLTSLSPAGATFRVTTPEGVSKEANCLPGQSTSATVTLDPVGPMPESGLISAANPEEAGRQAAARYPASENGTGEWTIEVMVSRNYASPVHPVSSSISWTAACRVETYSLDIRELQAP